MSRVETRVEVDGENSDEDLQVDRDKQYSAIPAFAFTLDIDSFPGSDHTVQTSTNFSCLSQPEMMPHRSLYSSNVHQSKQNRRTKKHKRSEENIDREKMEILKACKPLAAQAQTHASPEARQVLLLLCSEFVEYLRSRCDCCEKKRRHKKKPRSRFRTIGNKLRGGNTQALDDAHEHK